MASKNAAEPLRKTVWGKKRRVKIHDLASRDNETCFLTVRRRGEAHTMTFRLCSGNHEEKCVVEKMREKSVLGR